MVRLVDFNSLRRYLSDSGFSSYNLFLFTKTKCPGLGRQENFFLNHFMTKTPISDFYFLNEISKFVLFENF